MLCALAGLLVTAIGLRRINAGKASVVSTSDLLGIDVSPAAAIQFLSCALTGLMATAFGPSYAYLMLRLLYGRRWSDTEAPAALGWYCPYIALLAVNGITEAYLHATAQGRYTDCRGGCHLH